jgi:hypothetical protein
MNEKEKKAIEELSKKAVFCNYEERDYPNMICFKKDMLIVLNLIEKLQKENEELKEYILKAPNLDEMTATKYTIIRQEAYIQGIVEERQKAKQIIYENYIPVQKVKDKIEEEKLPLTIVGGRKNKKTLEYGIKLGRRQALQELIEEREKK